MRSFYSILSRDLENILNKDQLSIHYQPIYNVKTKSIEKLEALLRWNHPIYGNISPQIFIPLSEENGSIIEIGEWCLEKSCNDILYLNEKYNMSVNLSVNISPIQLSDKNIVSHIERILLETKFNPRLLILEVTENFLVNDFQCLQKKIDKISQLGIDVYIDDFGAGFSNLAYLSGLLVKGIKIDKSLLTGLAYNEKNMIIINSIIKLSHDLNLLVVAEGIETKNEFDLLANSECDYLQGYYFSEPKSLSEIGSLVDSFNLALRVCI